MNEQNQKPKNFTGMVVFLTIAINGLIALLFFMPKTDKFSHLDITFLPLLNAVMNSFTFIFLLSALIMIKQRTLKPIDDLSLRLFQQHLSF